MAHRQLPKMSREQIELFWSHVGSPNSIGCRPWLLSSNVDGRGVVTIGKVQYVCNRIVAMLTHGLPKSEQIARHFKCDNPICCTPEHICWGTVNQNSLDAIRLGTCSMGERHYNTRLTDSQIACIRRLWSTRSGTQEVLARLFKVQQSYVSRLVNGVRR